MSSPNPSLLFGPLLCGTFLNTILYGVCLIQSFVYYRTYKRDATWIRFFVLYLFVLETLNTGFNIGMMYEPLILEYGKPKALIVSPKMLVANPLLTSIISTSAQYFIAWRIKVISGSFMVPLIIVALGSTSLGGGVTLTAFVAQMPSYAAFQNFKVPIVIWLAASAAADLLITISLSWSLSRRKTGIKETDDKIAKIIRITIHTGLLTAILALADLIVFVTVPHTTLNFAWDLTLSKVYVNALLSTLNARASNVASTSTGDHNVLFGRLQISNQMPMSTFKAYRAGTMGDTMRNASGVYEMNSNARNPTFHPHVDSKFANLENGIAITTVVERLEENFDDFGEKDAGMHRLKNLGDHAV